MFSKPPRPSRRMRAARRGSRSSGVGVGLPSPRNQSYSAWTGATLRLSSACTRRSILERGTTAARSIKLIGPRGADLPGLSRQTD